MHPAATPWGVLNRAILDCLAQLPTPPKILALAVSGGVDSAMLAVHTASMAHQYGWSPHCLHIHHGLHPEATRWQAQVHALAQSLGLACHSLHVKVAQNSGAGIEAAARHARYQGLTQLAHTIGAQHVLLAHHQDDQAETVLLRLLRGTGSQGLAAMKSATQRHGLTWLRPWLALERKHLLDAAATFQQTHTWQAVDDPSNTDARYTRSALRVQIAPALDARWPAWRRNLARHARLAAEQNTVLQEVAAQDFSGLAPSPDGNSFSLAAWRQLSSARQTLVLRYWLAQHSMQMPTERKLQDILRQLRTLHALGHDRHLQIRHDTHSIACVRGRVLLKTQG